MEKKVLEMLIIINYQPAFEALDYLATNIGVRKFAPYDRFFEKTGISRSQYYRWRKGRYDLTLTQLVGLSVLLDISPEQLYSIDRVNAIVNTDKVTKDLTNKHLL